MVASTHTTRSSPDIGTIPISVVVVAVVVIVVFVVGLIIWYLRRRSEQASQRRITPFLRANSEANVNIPPLGAGTF